MAILQQQQQSPRIRYLIGFSALIIVMFSLIVSYQANNGYTQAIKEADQNSQRLANILGEHVEIIFLGVDLSLRRAIEQRTNAKDTDKNFGNWLNDTPQITALAMLNDKGMVEVSANKKGYESWVDYSKRLVGQRLFERMRTADDNDVFIGKYYIQGSRSVILLSRRYSKAGGAFGGVVVAAIDPNYFVQFYDSIASGKQKFMSIMLSADGTILSSGPYNSPATEAIGKDLLAAQEKTPTEIYTQRVQSSDSIKTVSIKMLQNMPIAVGVTLDESDFLADWQQSRFKDIGFLVLFAVFGSILSFFAVVMARQVMRVQESENAAILASQAKSEFLANMSHELRTPLNAIIGFSEMINSGYFGGLNDKQKERIYDINLCGSHLLQLITDILEFSKGDAGKLELVEEQVDINELIDESVRIMKGKIKTKGINLITEAEPNIPMLWGDKRKIRQILINLLSNAFKFTPEQGNITVSAHVDAHNNLVLTVTDNGVGIAEGDIPKALSVFGQVHRSKSHEGTGLGLPLCKMYAELHDGKLILASKQNEGTSVTIIFPHQRMLPHKSIPYSPDY